MKKRALSLLLVLVLVLTTAPIAVADSTPFFVWPTNGKSVYVLDHYVTSGAHKGVDITVTKQPVYAVANGTVVHIANDCGHYSAGQGHSCGESTYGNYIKIEHKLGGKTYTSVYAHLLKNSMTVKVGDTVYSGQTIATSGSSGSSTGPHLHLVLYEGNNTEEKRRKTFQYYLNEPEVLEGMSFRASAVEKSEYFKTWIKENCNLSNDGYYYYNSNDPVLQYLNQCTSFECNWVLRVLYSGNMKNMPCSASTNAKSETIEALTINRRYPTTRGWKNTEGNIWYEVRSSGGKRGFIYKGDVTLETPEIISSLSVSGHEGNPGTPTGTLKKGANFGLRGVISSNYTITQVSAHVYNSNGADALTAYNTSWNSTSYNIQTDGINNAFSFSKLAEGSYRYLVSATDASGTTRTLIDSAFSIGASNPVAPNAPTVNVNGQNVTVSWNDVANEASYSVYLVQAPWRWEDIKYSASVGANTTTHTFTNVEYGDYQAFIVSRPNQDAVQSGWTSFIVARPILSYSFQFDTPEGTYSGEMNDFTVENDQQFTIPLNQYVKAGYDFVGWKIYRISNSKQYITEGNGWHSDTEITQNGFDYRLYEDGATRRLDQSWFTNADGEINSFHLSPVWQPRSYRINFDPYGGNGSMTAITVNYADNFVFPANTFSKEGYSFVGWHLYRNNDNRWDTYKNGWRTETEINNSGYDLHLFEDLSSKQLDYSWIEGCEKATDFTLYAVWKEIVTETYTVSFDANGGSGAPGAQTKIWGKVLTLSSTKPTRMGYTFLGWAESSSATAAAYTAGGSFTKDGDTTLYAVWKIHTYTISFNANGGTGAPKAQTKTYGKTLTLSKTVPTREGYSFLGWAASKTATKATYQPGGKYTKNAKATLYAVWEKSTVLDGLQKGSDGKYYLYKDGAVNTSFSGLYTNADGTWYVVRGRLADEVSGCRWVGDEYVELYLGQLTTWKKDATVVDPYGDGNWVSMRYGRIDMSFTGIAENENGFWYIKDGILDLTFTGLVTNDYGTWFIYLGQLANWRTGCDWVNGEYCEFVEGQLTTWKKDATLVDPHGDDNWVAMRYGRIDMGYTGLADNQYGWWYVKNGRLNRELTDLVTNDYGTWYVYKGQLVTWKDGIQYVEKRHNSYYIYKGQLADWYTGDVVENGVVYHVSAGLVTGAN